MALPVTSERSYASRPLTMNGQAAKGPGPRPWREEFRPRADAVSNLSIPLLEGTQVAQPCARELGISANANAVGDRIYSDRQAASGTWRFSR
jgi:hypothetical protein